MRRTKRLIAVAPVTVALAIAAVGLGPAAIAQTGLDFDEASALLSNERNTIDVIDRFGASVVAVSVSVRGETMSPFAGLPDEEVSRAFTGGQPLSAKPTAGEPSTGLGLLIVRRVVEAVRDGRLDEAHLDRAVAGVLQLVARHLHHRAGFLAEQFAQGVAVEFVQFDAQGFMLRRSNLPTGSRF